MQESSVKNKVINFINLPDWDCALLIQNNLLEALEIEDDTYLEWEIIAKLTSVSYETRKSICNLFNSALKRNKQKIAGIEISAWLEKYEKKFPSSGLAPDNFLEFVLKNPELQKLKTEDQHTLAKIFRMHDYLFVKPFQSLQDKFASIILNNPIRREQNLLEVKQKNDLITPENQIQRQITEKLPLRELLRKYPAVGEQMATGGQLKLAHFDRPVRPSIRNWIYDYTSQLGQERHDSMQRMKYLFSSENGKALSSPDREKLGIILKSFDENAPLAVDAGRNEIMFDVMEHRAWNMEQKSAIQGQTFSRSEPPRPQSFIKPYPRIRETKPVIQPSALPASRPTKQLDSQTAAGMQFTSPYPKPARLDSEARLGTHEPQVGKPAENISNVRFAEGLPQPRKPESQSIPPPKPVFRPPRRNIIEPIGRARPEPRIEGNVVDLSREK